MSEKKEQEFSLEENFARLEETIEKLGEEDLPLEEAFQAYSQGMAILKQCDAQIDRVEKQVLKLTEEGGLEVFENGEQ
ncbi:MAG: exodeoxyribonuclease VII small subunit [Acetatifactor sp.]